MAFDSLSERLQGTIKKFSGQGRLTEKNMEDMLSEIRLALLEADVNYQVVKEFIAATKEKALGQDVLGSLKPGQVVVKIVHDELVTLLGTTVSEINYDRKPTIIMMVGLQGSGKTTTSGKIANLIAKKHGKRPLLVAADIYRPAAVDQLKTLGEQLNVPVYEKGTSQSAESIVEEALGYARENNNDVIIIDTAGRLHIDEPLMHELANIKEIAHPHEILLVVDALTGQDIVNVASSFNEQLGITGAVLTKLDGDSRGGGALSIRHITHVPIKFVGVSEKMDGLEEFYPDRMASRILGMGDIMSMLEKAESVIDEEEAMNAAKKMGKGTFDLEDFLSTMRQIKKLGPLENLLKMLPGASKMGLKNVKVDPKDMAHLEAIILSMTPYERRHPEVLKASRKKRIANGSGRSVEEVNRLVNQFEQMKKMMKQMKNGNMKMPF